MEQVCVSAFFAKPECGEDLNVMESSENIDKCELDELCENVDMVQLCEDVENAITFDAKYDDELFQICTLVENSDIKPSTSYSVQMGRGGAYKRNGDSDGETNAKTPRREEASSSDNTDKRGFPFDEDEGSGAWSELAARHPDIAARLRQRPATWARKRRPSSQDATDDFGDGFSGFDRFPFDDIPPEFREHFPSHWNRRFGPRDEPSPHTHHEQNTQAAPQSPPAQQHTTATQTEQEPEPQQYEQPTTHLPQYGLRNTVDLGQKSPADPSLVDADDRNQRSMSAPPDSSASPNQSFRMSGQNHQEHPQHTEQHSNVRHIPIFVEGRDEPVINKSADHGPHYGESKPAYQPPPQPQPHIDREQYFADDGPVGFHHPPNFSRAFGTPFNKGFRQGPQPFVQQKVYPQAAYTRGASPHRSQSPKPHPYPEEPYVKVPVHHEQHAAKTETPSRTMPQQRQAPPQQHQPPHPQQQKQPPPPQQQRQQTPPQQAPPREQTPPQPKQPTPNDPITLILSIQTDVLNLMTEVENFKGAKNDKQYMFLDEMLTRNLIKLDNIETEGKENIRLARKEAIKCIQKCIAVLEAKAEKNSAASQSQADVEMENTGEQAAEPAAENGEVEAKEATKEQEHNEPQAQVPAEQPVEVAPQEAKTEPQQVQQPAEAKVEEKNPDAAVETKEATEAPQSETRPEEKTEPLTENKKDETESPKTKVVKKLNKSKDIKKDVPNDSSKQDKEDSNKEQKQVDEKSDKVEIMQVDGDKTEQGMEVDGAASQ